MLIIKFSYSILSQHAGAGAGAGASDASAHTHTQRTHRNSQHQISFVHKILYCVACHVCTELHSIAFMRSIRVSGWNSVPIHRKRYRWIKLFVLQIFRGNFSRIILYECIWNSFRYRYIKLQKAMDAATNGMGICGKVGDEPLAVWTRSREREV